MSGPSDTEISKTLSFWLRHKPEDAGLVMDASGWIDTDAVVAALADRFAVDFDRLLAVVEDNDKQRFEFSPDLATIRARQGHSVEIDLALAPQSPPERLFHGTVERSLPAILAEGLKKMRRHHVHLSGDLETARRVGSRRGVPVILQVDCAAMAADGAQFMQSANGVWLTDFVAPKYLSRVET